MLYESEQPSAQMEKELLPETLLKITGDRIHMNRLFVIKLTGEKLPSQVSRVKYWI